TRNNAYSLSDISKEVVQQLEDPLNIKVFFSKDLPAPYNTVDRYLHDLIEEYSQHGNDNFRYEFIDVEEEKDLASDFGIRSVQIREVKDDQVKFRNAYMGLAIVHGDLIEKIASLTEPEGMEYSITSLINKITSKINALLKLDQPIIVSLYSSSNLPISGIQNLDKKVAKIVENTNRKNFNKLEFRFVDPFVDKKSIDIADIYGITKLKWPSFKSMEGKIVQPGEGFVGIVIEHGDKFQTIQLLSRTIFGQYVVSNLDNMEERINNAIDNIISTNPKIGYITGHGERGLDNAQDESNNFKKMLSDMYELEMIDLTKEDIPEEISVIIVNGPKKKFKDYELLKIDQFLMSGKSALFFIDSFQEITPQGMNRFQRRQPMVLPLNTGIEKLIANYGVSVNKDIVLDKKCYKATQRGLGGQDIYFAPIIDEEGLNSTNIITKDLKKIVVPKVSSVNVNKKKIEEKGNKETILVSSSDQSWLMKGRINYMPWGMSPPRDSKMTKYNLAVLLSGDFESYFKNKPIPQMKPKDDDKKKKKPAKASPVSRDIQKKSVKPVNIIVIGTSEITTSNVVDPNGKSPNSIFLHNLVDYLAGNYGFPEMRTKGLEYNPLKDADDSVKFILKSLNIAGLPIIIIIIGFVIWRRRIARKSIIKEEFAANENK
ncbi:MAG: Gldg family protein, partial [Spirochaetota bacterium]|nr:Gldg family protein [Spirochaetota bacterium]